MTPKIMTPVESAMKHFGEKYSHRTVNDVLEYFKLNPAQGIDIAFYQDIKDEFEATCFDCGEEQANDPVPFTFARHEDVKICENCREQREKDDDEEENS